MAALVSGYIASATQPRNSATRARFGPIGGRTSGSVPLGCNTGSIACIRRSVGGSSRVNPTRSAQSSNPSRWSSRAGASAALTRPEYGNRWCRISRRSRLAFSVAGTDCLQRDLERLDDLTVLHSRGARRLARATVEAEVQVLADLAAHLQPAVSDRAHQVDSPARAIVLVARLDVGRATLHAEAAVDAVLVAPVLDPLRKPVEVDPRIAARGAGLVVAGFSDVTIAMRRPVSGFGKRCWWPISASEAPHPGPRRRERESAFSHPLSLRVRVG